MLDSSSVPACLNSPSPDRTLPHNLEAETSVLGAILIHNDAFNHAAEVIDVARFLPRRAPPHLRQDGRSSRERGDAIDFVTLKEELARSGELDEVGGPAYIASLVDGVPRSTNVEHYARIVKEKSTLRSLIYSANKILSDAPTRPRRSRTHPRRGRAGDLRDRRGPHPRRLRVAARPRRRAASPTIEKLHAAQGARHRRADRLHRSRRDDLRPPAVATSSSSRRARRWARRASC